MADNVEITEGSGLNVAADDVSSVFFQKIKLDLGTDGATAPALAGAGAVATGVQRITLASDDPAVALLGTIDTDTGVIAGDTTSIDGKITACNTGAVVLATGSAAIGKLAANTGVDIGDVDITSIVPGVAATNLGKAEDAGHSSGDTGVMALTVRQDTAAALSGTDADYQPLITDASGRLHIAPLVAGSAAIGKLAANTGVDIGDVDVTSIIPLTGATNLGKARDVACGANDVGVMALAVRDDTLTTLTPADGDYAPLRVSSTGQLHVTDANITACNTGAVVLSSGTVTTVSTVTNLSQMGGTALSMDEGVVDAGCQRVTLATDDDGVAHLATIAGDTTAIETAVEKIDDWDATHASAASADGPQVMGVAYSTALPTDVGADADAARICTDRFGRIVRGLMPQWFNAVYDSADASGEGETVKAKTASRKIYILSLTISVDAEMWVKLQDEDSNAITPKHWFKAGGGKTITYPPEAPLVLNVVNKDLEVITEGAGNIGVEITGYLAV